MSTTTSKLENEYQYSGRPCTPRFVLMLPIDELEELEELEEPSEDEHITPWNTNVLARLTGGDTFFARDLLRTYKATCSVTGCDRVTHVTNPERLGGMCYACCAQTRAQETIAAWYRKIIKRRQRLEAIRVIVRHVTENNIPAHVARYI